MSAAADTDVTVVDYSSPSHANDDNYDGGVDESVHQHHWEARQILLKTLFHHHRAVAIAVD